MPTVHAVQAVFPEGDRGRTSGDFDMTSAVGEIVRPKSINAFRSRRQRKERNNGSKCDKRTIPGFRWFQE